MSTMIDSLTTYLKNHPHVHNIVLTVRSPLKLKKTGNPYGTIYKTQDVKLCVNHTYANAVNAQRVNEGVEGTFKSNQTWGISVDGLYNLIEHERTVYLQGILLGYENEPSYDHDGAPIKYSEFEQFVPSVNKSASRQDVELVVNFRKINANNIVSFRPTMS